MRSLAAPLLLATAMPLAAQGLDASARLDAGAWWYQTSQQPQQDLSTPVSVLLQGKWSAPDSGLRAVVDGRVGNGAFFAGRNYGVLREGYLEVARGDWRLKLGQLLLPWGRADGINPTNSLVSQNWQWRTPADDDQKFGNTGAALTAEVAGGALSAVWLPFMRSSTIPFVPALAGAAVEQPTYLGNAGVRFDRVGQAVDWSMTYYQGVDLWPSLAADLSALRTPFTFYNSRIERAGGDFVWNLGRGTARGEIAYTRVLDGAPPVTATLPGSKNNYWKAVIGVDRAIADDANLNVQFIWQHTMGPVSLYGGPPDSVLARVVALQNLVNQQPVADLYGLSFRASRRLLNDTLTLELQGLGYAPGQGGALRPRASYQLTDVLTVEVGANWFFGGSASLLGVLKGNNTLFAQLRYTLDRG